MSLKFIQVVTCANSLFLFIAEWYSIAWIYYYSLCNHLPIERHLVVSKFWLLQPFIYRLLYGYNFSVVWNKCLGVQLLLFKINVSLVFVFFLIAELFPRKFVKFTKKFLFYIFTLEKLSYKSTKTHCEVYIIVKTGNYLNMHQKNKMNF